MKQLNMPMTVQACGIEEETYFAAIERLALDAFDDQCTPANPRLPLVSELVQIYKDIYKNEDGDIVTQSGSTNISDSNKELASYYIDENGNESKVVFNPVTNNITTSIDAFGSKTTYKYYVYLDDDNNWIELRSRTVKLSLLNKKIITQDRTRWQVINVAVPVLVLLTFGLIYQFVRKRKYSK